MLGCSSAQWGDCICATSSSGCRISLWIYTVCKLPARHVCIMFVTVSAHQLGEFPKKHSTKYHERVDEQRCSGTVDNGKFRCAVPPLPPTTVPPTCISVLYFLKMVVSRVRIARRSDPWSSAAATAALDPANISHPWTPETHPANIAHLEMRPPWATGQWLTARSPNAMSILTVRNPANLQDLRAKYCTEFDMLGTMSFLLQLIARKSEKWTADELNTLVGCVSTKRGAKSKLTAASAEHKGKCEEKDGTLFARHSDRGNFRGLGLTVELLIESLSLLRFERESKS